MFTLGQAAGAAAALAARQGRSPRDLDVSEIQQVLVGQGALLGPDRDPQEVRTAVAR